MYVGLSFSSVLYISVTCKMCTGLIIGDPFLLTFDILVGQLTVEQNVNY